MSAQATGQAWVRKHGAVHILDLVAWLKKNPILAALIAALDAAVLAWSKQVFFGAGSAWRLSGRSDDSRQPTAKHP